MKCKVEKFSRYCFRKSNLWIIHMSYVSDSNIDHSNELCWWLTNLLAVYIRLGPWRWFDDSMLDCCEPLEKVRSEGITFGKVACLAHCNGANVEAFRANESTVDEFRKFVISCSSSEDCHVITSYHRGSFKQVPQFRSSQLIYYSNFLFMCLEIDYKCLEILSEHRLGRDIFRQSVVITWEGTWFSY